jgi:pimeloyl-ACP methyl ester carboxylesterase
MGTRMVRQPMNEGVARREMQVNGRALCWLEAGQGDPLVVLEAGYSDTSLAWAAVVPLLADRTRVIAYDRAGLGASDPDPALPTIDRRLADLTALIEHAGASPCVLVGHSWGGILAWALACRRPDLVAGLVLVDPADLDMLATLPAWAGWVVRVATEQLVVRLKSPGVRQEWRGILRSVPAILELQATSRLPDIPVVVLSAGQGFPPRVRRQWTALQARLAASVPKGRHVVVRDSGHAIPKHRPEVVSELTLELVSGLRR